MKIVTISQYYLTSCKKREQSIRHFTGDSVMSGYFDLNGRWKGSFSHRRKVDLKPQVLKVCNPGFHHYGGYKALYDPIATLKCFEDNSKVREQLGRAGQGRVQVLQTA
jgi:hypothetical protein